MNKIYGFITNILTKLNLKKEDNKIVKEERCSHMEILKKYSYSGFMCIINRQ